jgi:hypothetical protein
MLTYNGDSEWRETDVYASGANLVCVFDQSEFAKSLGGAVLGGSLCSRGSGDRHHAGDDARLPNLRAGSSE